MGDAVWHSWRNLLWRSDCEHVADEHQHAENDYSPLWHICSYNVIYRQQRMKNTRSCILFIVEVSTRVL